jgi:hypothetical protein
LDADVTDRVVCIAVGYRQAAGAQLSTCERSSRKRSGRSSRQATSGGSKDATLTIQLAWKSDFCPSQWVDGDVEQD